ncbi:hypothetical protein [Gandjariella thermophila]|uniref:Stress-response A/B barrel domain-containing protein n=1 Tax=Gandjariella thermophila TaxID=1931992 RepID=A0A4D4JEK9_9PSEU|nr:hypothetical protein [Gandjariella thermophila]GDY34094.1 hypothetical protein GTS_57270 [Gandjariella thermophila]
MATYVQIFLRPLQARSVQSVVDEVGRAVGTQLLGDPAHLENSYVGVRDGTSVELFVDHGYEDDDDMPFSSHPYMLRFRTLKRDVADARAYMERTYAALKNTGNYSMFSTYDLQDLLHADTVAT